MANSLKIYDTLKTALPEPEARAVTQAFEISHFETASKTDLELAIAQVETRLIRWMFVFWVGQVGVTVATVLTAVHLLKN